MAKLWTKTAFRFTKSGAKKKFFLIVSLNFLAFIWYFYNEENISIGKYFLTFLQDIAACDFFLISYKRIWDWGNLNTHYKSKIKTRKKRNSVKYHVPRFVVKFCFQPLLNEIIKDIGEKVIKFTQLDRVSMVSLSKNLVCSVLYTHYLKWSLLLLFIIHLISIIITL